MQSPRIMRDTITKTTTGTLISDKNEGVLYSLPQETHLSVALVRRSLGRRKDRNFK